MKMLFDPTKKQLYAPTGAIQVGNGECGELEVVGQKNQAQFFLGVEVMDAPQRIGIQLRSLRPGELNGLIGSQSGRAAHRSLPLVPVGGDLFVGREGGGEWPFERSGGANTPVQSLALGMGSNRRVLTRQR